MTGDRLQQSLIARAWGRAASWTTPILALIEIVLVWSGLLRIRTAVVVGIVVEAALWAAALSRMLAAARRYRMGRSAGLDGWRAAESALAELVPRPAARVILFEPRLWWCLVIWLLRRYPHTSAKAFRYDASVRMILWVAVGLVFVEGAAVDVMLLLAIPGSAWIWVVFGIHTYALLGLLGLLASFIISPHVLCGDALRLRDGIFTEIEIPYAAILDIRAARHAHFGRSGFTIDAERRAGLLAFGDANAVIALDPARLLRVNGRPCRVALTEIALTVDRPADFFAGVRRRLAAAPDGRSPQRFPQSPSAASGS